MLAAFILSFLVWLSQRTSVFLFVGALLFSRCLRVAPIFCYAFGMESLVAMHFEGLILKKAEAWNLCHPELLTLAHRVINSRAPEMSPQDKEAIESDSITVLYEKAERFTSAKELTSFLNKIVSNKSISEIRRRDKVESLTKTNEHGEGYEVIPLDLVDTDDASSIAEEIERDLLLAEALQQVGSPCKEMLERRFLKDETEREVGEALRFGTSSVHNRIKVCLKTMKDIFEKMQVLGELQV